MTSEKSETTGAPNESNSNRPPPARTNGHTRAESRGRSRRTLSLRLPAMVGAVTMMTVSPCASDSTEPPLTTDTVSSTPPPEGPGLPEVEPGTNLEPMMEEPEQNDDTQRDTSHSVPSTDRAWVREIPARLWSRVHAYQRPGTLTRWCGAAIRHAITDRR